MADLAAFVLFGNQTRRGRGIMERIVSDTPTIWLIVFGVVLLPGGASASRRRREVSFERTRRGLALWPSERQRQ